MKELLIQKPPKPENYGDINSALPAKTYRSLWLTAVDMQCGLLAEVYRLREVIEHLQSHIVNNQETPDSDSDSD